MTRSRCPFRVAAFDQPDECDARCAWLLTDAADPEMHACAVAVLACNVGDQMNETDVNTWVIENEVSYESE